MKIRTGFVSNSSSSSFLVLVDISDIMPCIALNNEQRENILAFMEAETYFPYDKDAIKRFREAPVVYLTGFLDDCDNRWADVNKRVPEEDRLFYLEGDHGGTPRCYEYYHNIGEGEEEEGVYISSEHDNWKVYAKEDIVKVLHKEKYLLKELTNGTIELKPQEDETDEYSE